MTNHTYTYKYTYTNLQFSISLMVNADLSSESYLSQFAEQLRDAGQSLCGPFEVSVLKNQLNQLWVAGAHSLLQN
jgi:hypothetical protein